MVSPVPVISSILEISPVPAVSSLMQAAAVASIPGSPGAFRQAAAMAPATPP